MTRSGYAPTDSARSPVSGASMVVLSRRGRVCLDEMNAKDQQRCVNRRSVAETRILAGTTARWTSYGPGWRECPASLSRHVTPLKSSIPYRSSGKYSELLTTSINSTTMLLPITKLSAARIRLPRQATPSQLSARFYARNADAAPVKLRGAFVTPTPAPERETRSIDRSNVRELDLSRKSGSSGNTAWRDASPPSNPRRDSFRDSNRSGRDDRRPGGRRGSIRHDRKDEGPYYFSQTIKKWIERNEIPNKPLTGRQVEEVTRMITSARPDNVNAAVWNLVLALLGRQGQFGNMWKAYNQMKKRGTMPSSRTYTVMLNAFAGVAHGGVAQKTFTPQTPPEPLTLRRVNAIYEHSQRHVQKYLKYANGEGLERDIEADEDREGFVNEAQVNIMPTNAYLKFLSRYGMWKEMQTVFLAMDPHGPLAPDQVTYATMLNTINNIDHYRRASAGREGAVKLPAIEPGPQARLLWDQAVRALHPATAGRKLDEGVALAALQCFVAGRPEDKRFAETLIPRLWGFSAPNAPTVASLATPQVAEKDNSLPRLRLDVRSATQLMSLLVRLGRTSVSAHYTSQILERDIKFDMPALRAAIHNLAAVHDVEAAMNVLDQNSEAWPLDVLNAVLSAARWSKDWDTALSVYRRFTHLPQGVEKGNYKGQYKWESPNGRPTDSRGRRWIKNPVEPDLQSMDLLLRAGLEAGIPATREALNIYKYYPRERWYTITAQGELCDVKDHIPNPGVNTRRKIEERLEFARTVERAADTLQFKAKDKKEKEDMQKIIDDVKRVMERWKDLKNIAAQEKEKDGARGRESANRSGRPWDKQSNRRQDSEFPKRRTGDFQNRRRDDDRLTDRQRDGIYARRRRQEERSGESDDEY